MSRQLPHTREAIVGPNGTASPTFYKWLQRMQSAMDSAESSEPEEETPYVGIAPIRVNGQNISLQTLDDSGVGVGLWKFTRDDYGRVEGTEAATAADLPYDNTTSGLAATDLQGAVDELAASSGAGGILPMVNGDVPPTLVYAEDGSLIYFEV